MITLTHSGMHVPTDRIRVTSVKEVAVGSGVAWSAVLRNGTTKLGVVFNDGSGGDTRFHAENERAKRVVAHFVSQCRDQHGEPMGEIAVVDALADEYDITCEVTSAERRNAYYVRYFDHVDIPGRLTFKLKRSTPPNYEAALKAAAHLDLPTEAVRAQLWMGDRWVEFFRTDHVPE